jgi:hypothetical protein
MRNELLKTLWLLRFEKIKKTEEDAAWNYQEIFDQCLIDFGSHDETAVLLEQLVRDERLHARLGEELIRICHRNHPEFEGLSP